MKPEASLYNYNIERLRKKMKREESYIRRNGEWRCKGKEKGERKRKEEEEERGEENWREGFSGLL